MKPLTYYADTAETKQVASKYGDRLGGLCQQHKFELISTLGICLYELSDEDFEPVEFEQLEDTAESALHYLAQIHLEYALSLPVVEILNMLDDCEPQVLADIVPAIALYAADEARK
jgi:hypothetical protein